MLIRFSNFYFILFFQTNNIETLIYSTLFILTNKEKKLLKLIDKKIEMMLKMQD
jgi:hypothetical protein